MVEKKKKKKTTKKATKKTVATIKKEVPVIEERKEDEGYRISPFYHAVIVLMTVLLYVEMLVFAVIYFNYEITMETVTRADARRAATLKQKIMAERPEYRIKEKSVHIQKGTCKKCPAFKCPEPVARKVAFNEAEYAPYAKGGSAVIEGNACFELNDKTTKCFENTDIFINPVTTYSDEWYNRGWAGREALQVADERAIKLNKMIKTGKDGAFKFTNLKSGSYYVGIAVCLPEGTNNPNCKRVRYAAKVTVKDHVKPNFVKVFP